MKTLAIITPSYSPDLQRFIRLHESVLRMTDSSVHHHVIVPKRDFNSFLSIRSPRLAVWAEPDFLPPGFIATGRLAALGRKLPLLPGSINCSAVNLRRPWPPVRGWILQQILKLSAATQVDADAIAIIDSDVVLLRPTSVDAFFRGGAVRLYEKPEAVTAGLERHLLWTRTAYALLGIPWQERSSYPDYVGGVVSWDPKILSDCLHRIEQVSGSTWATRVAGCLHFSEFILYGTYVRHFGSEHQQSFSESRSLCHSYWSPSPLTRTEAEAFIAAYDPRDLAVHVQSNSGTSPQVTESIVAELSRRST